MKKIILIMTIVLASFTWASASYRIKGNFGLCGAESDPAVFRPTNPGVVYIHNSCNNTDIGLTNIDTMNAGSAEQWFPFNNGTVDDVGTVNTDSIGGFYAGQWKVYSLNTNSMVVNTVWGTSGDIAQVGDVNGDTFDDLCVYRPSNYTWYCDTRDGGYYVRQFGGPFAGGGLPVMGDYDGDGRADLAVYDPEAGKFVVYITSTEQQSTVVFHHPYWSVYPLIHAKVLSADFDGDGTDELAFYLPRDGGNNIGIGLWTYKDISGASGSFGQPSFDGSMPVPAYYGQLGTTPRDQFGIFTNGTWGHDEVLESFSYWSFLIFGTNGDIPLQNYRVRDISPQYNN